MVRVSALLLLLTWGTYSLAGVFELGGQANYRSTNYDPSHSDVMESGTASLGYYFWGLSALEISYTRGVSLQTQPEYQAYQELTAYGADFMITFANQNSAFKPYIKLGAVYIDKTISEFFNNDLPSVSIETKGIAPSGGLGLKLMMSQSFALKAGLDVSTSPIFMYTSTSPDPDTITYDFAAYGGLSFFF